MSNLDLIKRAYAAMATRDWDSAGDLLHPEIELRPPAAGIDTAESYRGRDGLERYVENTDQVWESFASEPRNFIDAGEGVVVVLAHSVGVGRASGVKVDIDVAHLWRIRDGLIAEMTIYLDPAEAFREAGLG
jgi:ketosteroid isomerase-like protein